MKQRKTDFSFQNNMSDSELLSQVNFANISEFGIVALNFQIALREKCSHEISFLLRMD